MFDGNRVDSDNLSAATCGQLYTAQAIPDVYGRNSHVYTTTNATYAGTTLYIHLITFYSLQIIRCIFLDIRYPSRLAGSPTASGETCPGLGCPGSQTE